MHHLTAALIKIRFIFHADLKKLSEEFFSGSIQSFSIPQDFIHRLEEYELITTNQASNLGVITYPTTSSDKSTLSELSEFIDSFMASTKKLNQVARSLMFYNKLQAYWITLTAPLKAAEM